MNILFQICTAWSDGESRQKVENLQGDFLPRQQRQIPVRALASCHQERERPHRMEIAVQPLPSPGMNTNMYTLS